MKKWICAGCGWIYDEAEGDPAHNIPAGTLWEELPADWCCPSCERSREQFELADVVG
jgi:rubredoxin